LRAQSDGAERCPALFEDDVCVLPDFVGRIMVSPGMLVVSDAAICETLETMTVEAIDRYPKANGITNKHSNEDVSKNLR